MDWLSIGIVLLAAAWGSLQAAMLRKAYRALTVYPVIAPDLIVSAYDRIKAQKRALRG